MSEASQLSIENENSHNPEVGLTQGNLFRKFGMWLFLSSELLIFGGLIFVFAYTRDSITLKGEHWPHFEIVPSLLLVSFNTFILLASSWFVVEGIESIRRNDSAGLRKWLLLTIVGGLAFLLGQAVEYTTLIAVEGHSMAEPFGGAFFSLTGLHGLHVFAGVIWCLLLIPRVSAKAFSAKNYTTVEMFGLYWHFVDVVWILIFTVIYLLNG